MITFRGAAIVGAVAMTLASLGAFAARPANNPPAPAASGPASAPGGFGRSYTPPDPRPRTVAPYFTPPTPGAKSPDPEGFLQRWLLLEPLPNGLRSNAGFTESFVRKTLDSEEFRQQYALTPRHGEQVTLGGQQLTWHALDSTLFNAKLFRFAYGVNKPIYGVTFLAYTVVDSPDEKKDVRLAVGSNSASLWWVNGQEAVGLFGDRRMVVDDCVSKRITLRKGRNVIRGAVINGPGMSDFCVRFIDDAGNPIKDLTTTFESSGN